MLKPFSALAMPSQQIFELKINKVSKSISERQQKVLDDKKALLEATLKDSELSASAFVELTTLVRLIEAIESAVDLRGYNFEGMLPKQQIEGLHKLFQEKDILTNSDDQYDHFKKIQINAEKKLREIIALTAKSAEAGESHEII